MNISKRIRFILIFTITLIFNGRAFVSANHKVGQTIYDVNATPGYADKKITSLAKTILDLDFPEDKTKHTFRRLVQFVMGGEVNDVQKRHYRNVKLHVSSREPYVSRSIKKDCTQEIHARIVKCIVDINTHQYTIVPYGTPQTKVLPRGGSVTYEFFNVLNIVNGVDMSNFWVEFTIKNRCHKTLYVELVEPNNYADSTFQKRTS